MVPLMKAFWNDEAGFLITSELVIVATLLVVGLVVGFTAVQAAVVGELRDVGQAVGSVNQSYGMTGFKSYHRDGSVKAFTVGSGFLDRQDAGDARNDFAHPPRHGEFPHRPRVRPFGPGHPGRPGIVRPQPGKPGEPRREPIDEAEPLPKPPGQKGVDKPTEGKGHPSVPPRHTLQQYPQQPVVGRGHNLQQLSGGRVFIPGVGILGCDKSGRGAPCVQPSVPGATGDPQAPAVIVPQTQSPVDPERQLVQERPLPVYPPQPPVITIPIVDGPGSYQPTYRNVIPATPSYCPVCPTAPAGVPTTGSVY